jgi:hypothetical protein
MELSFAFYDHSNYPKIQDNHKWMNVIVKYIDNMTSLWLDE